MTILERGFTHVIKDLGGNKRSWESQPPWVNDGSKYVPYIYSRDESKKCYRVQVGLVGAVIYDTGVVEIYDPELKEVRVKGEEWEVWQGTKKATLVAPITWGVVEDSSGVYITREQTTSNPVGVLRIVYGFVVGASLKHTVIWTSTESNPVTVQVKQVHLMDFDKVTTDTGLSTESKSERSTAYLFGYSSKGFWLFENQYAMVYDSKSLAPGTLLTDKCLLYGKIDFAGKKVTYTFGDWTLALGESLVIDPTTSSLSDPTQDGQEKRRANSSSSQATACANCPTGTLSRVNGQVELRFGGGVGNDCGVCADYCCCAFRSWVEWPIVSLAGATLIANPVFKYHGGDISGIYEEINPLTEEAPSVASDINLWGYIASGTAYVDPFNVEFGTNKQVDLGASAKTDLQAAINAAQSWFAIGLQNPGDECGGSYSWIYGEINPSATPKPTLYVEYTVPVAHTQTIADILGLADALPAPKGAFKTGIIDTLGLLESAPLVASYHATASEFLGLLDSSAVRSDRKQAILDLLGLLDSSTVRGDRKQAILDLLGLLESAPLVASYHATASELLGLLDSSAVRSDQKQAISEFLGMLDVIAFPFHIAIMDSLGMVDTAAPRADWKQAISELLGMSDILPAPKGIYKKSVADILGMLDSAAPRADLKQTLTEVLGLLDSSTTLETLRQTILDTLGLLESTPLVASYHVTASDILGLLESAATRGAFKKTVSDLLGLLESTPLVANYHVTTSELLGLLDSSTTLETLRQTILDTLGLLESTPLVASYHVTASELLGLLDSSAVRSDRKQSISDLLGMLDSAAPRADMKQTLTELLGLLDSVEKVATYQQAISDILGISDSVAKVAAYHATILDALGLYESAEAYIRIVAQVIILQLASRGIVLSRTEKELTLDRG